MSFQVHPFFKMCTHKYLMLDGDADGEREKKSKYEKSIVPYNMLTMFPNGLRLMGNNGCLEYLAQGPSKICNKKTFQKCKTTKYFGL